MTYDIEYTDWDGEQVYKERVSGKKADKRARKYKIISCREAEVKYILEFWDSNIKEIHLLEIEAKSIQGEKDYIEIEEGRLKIPDGWSLENVDLNIK